MYSSANKRAVRALGAALLLAGCSLAPRYERPAVETPPAYREWLPARPRDAQPRGNWWELFGDAQLDALEVRLSSSNQSVAAAAAAFLAARAVVTQARSAYVPSATTTPSVTRSHVGATPFGFSTGNSFTEYTLPFDASWQPDFWGKTRSAVAANVFAAQASAADLENVRLSASAELAVDYFQLRAQDALIGLLGETAAADRETLSLTAVLRRAGLESDQAVAQAQAQLDAARAQEVNAGIARAQYEHAIAALLGRPASAFRIEPAPFRAPEPAIPLGVPAELLERRPDVAAAERAVAQANAQIGVARAAYFPNVTLSASGGFESFSAGSWLEWAARFWSVGASAGETLFDGGLRGGVSRQAWALREQAAANYRQTALAAFSQVEDDLAAAALSAKDVRHQDAAAGAARRNLAEARARYTAGLDPYLNVLSARTAQLALEQTALSFRIQRVVAAVRLVEALGGGWDDSRLPKPRDLTRKP